MRFSWDKSLELGIKEIDDQHKELVSRANKLFDAMGKPSRSKEEVITILNYLSEYVIIHFKTEEELFKRYGYPGLEEHRLIHEEMKRRTLEIKDEISNKEISMKIKMDVNMLIIKWLKKHIDIDDREFVEFIKKNEK